jgi:hypothetical protein
MFGFGLIQSMSLGGICCTFCLLLHLGLVYWFCSIDFVSVVTFRKGDYYRYLAEFKTGNERKEAADQSLKAYQVYYKSTCLDGPCLNFLCLQLLFREFRFLFLVMQSCISVLHRWIVVIICKPLINHDTHLFWLEIICRLHQALP